MEALLAPAGTARAADLITTEWRCGANSHDMELRRRAR